MPYEFHVMLIGPPRTGKTNLIRVAVGEDFKEQEPTTKCSRTKMEVKTGSEADKLCVYDTSNQADLSTKYNLFKSMDAIVYVTNAHSLEEDYQTFDKKNALSQLKCTTDQVLSVKKSKDPQPLTFLIVNFGENLVGKDMTKALHQLASKLGVFPENAFIGHNVYNNDYFKEGSLTDFVSRGPVSLFKAIYNAVKLKALQDAFAHSKKIECPKIYEDYFVALGNAKEKKDYGSWRLIKKELVAKMQAIPEKWHRQLTISGSYHNQSVSEKIRIELTDEIETYGSLLTMPYREKSSFFNSKPKSAQAVDAIAKEYGATPTPQFT